MPSHDFVTEPGFNLVFDNQSHCESLDLGIVMLGMIASVLTRNDAAQNPGRFSYTAPPGALTPLAIVMAIVGWLYPTLIPLCFAPEAAGQAVVVGDGRSDEQYVAEAPDPDLLRQRRTWS